MKRLLLIVTLWVVSVPSFAQTTDFMRLLQGKTNPPTLMLKDLGEGWRRYSFSPINPQGLGGYLNFIYGMMGMVSPTEGARAYTKGETVTIGDQLFLITYTLRAKSMNPLMMGNMEATRSALKPDALTPDTKVYLSLINVKQSTGYFSIRAFDLQQEIKESEEAVKAAEKAQREYKPLGGAIIDG